MGSRLTRRNGLRWWLRVTRRAAAVRVVLVLVAVGVYGCSRVEPNVVPAAPPLVADLDASYGTHEVPGLEHRRFSPEKYWQLLLPIVASGGDRFSVTTIGQSIEGRPLRRIDFGRGETTVLLWSQMHGNESTASRALVDILNFLVSQPDHPLVQRLASKLHVAFVPIVNPDGAARFVRHNAIGIDLNRDARRLATPEARALKSVRDDLDAIWGFNLHDQNVRTRLGSSGRDVLIALLAPPPGQGLTSPANLAARRMCSLLAGALEPIVGDQVARYDESFNPRAFGDLMTSWGTSVVLIESGGELDDPDKNRLRRANYTAILTALDAIARDGWQHHDANRYLNLPLNSPWIHDLLVRRAEIILPGSEPIRVDFAVDFEDTLAQEGGTVVEVGDLAESTALDEIDATGLYFLPDLDALSQEHGSHLRIGDRASGVLARDRQGNDVVYRMRDGRLVEVE